MTRSRSHGWAVLGAAFAIITLSIGTLFTLGVFLKPIEDGMGWSRSGIGAIGLVNWLVMGAGGVVAGYLSDRFGTRRIVLAGGALLGAGLVLSSRVTELWQLYATFGVLVGGGVSAFYVPLTVARDQVVRGPARAGRRHRLGGQRLRHHAAVAAVALAHRRVRLADGVPGSGRPRVADRHPGGAAPAGAAGSSGGARLRRSPGRETRGRSSGHGRIWAIGLTHFACCAAHSGPIFHMVSHAIDLGVPSMAAATLLGVSGFSSIAGRILTGLAADRLGTKRTLVGMLVLQALMIALYLAARDLGALYALGLAFGVAYGGVMPLYALVTRDYFGERVMGTAYGMVFLISSIGMGLGSFAGGVVHDALGTYEWLFLGSVAVASAAVLLGLSLRPPARPAVAGAAPTLAL